MTWYSRCLKKKEDSVSFCFTKQKFMNYKTIIKIEILNEKQRKKIRAGQPPAASKKCGPDNQIADLGPADPL